MRPLPRDSIDDNDERGMTTDRQFKHDGLIIRWTLSAVYEGARSNVLQLGTDLAFKIPRGERLPRDDSLETRSVRDILNLGAGSIAGSSRRKVWHEVKRTSLLWHTNTFRETRGQEPAPRRRAATDASAPINRPAFPTLLPPSSSSRSSDRKKQKHKKSKMPWRSCISTDSGVVFPQRPPPKTQPSRDLSVVEQMLIDAIDAPASKTSNLSPQPLTLNPQP